jgi:hypothetical protein
MLMPTLKRLLIALCCILGHLPCFAKEVTFLREAFITCYAASQGKAMDYNHWAHLVAEVGDSYMVEAIAEAYGRTYTSTKCMAIETAETLLAAFPHNDFLLNQVAWTYYLLGTHTERAYQLARQIQRHEIATLDTLAMVSCRHGHLADALQLYFDILPRVYVDITINTPLADYLRAITIYNHMGDVLYKNKLYREATLVWIEAYTLTEYIKNDAIDPDLFPIFDYDYPRLKQKLRAIKIKMAVDAAKTKR